MMNQIAVSQRDALEVASVFMNAPAILGVDLVGSVAREGKGNDLDLVLLVNTFRYTTFVRSMTEWTGYDVSEDEQDDYYYGFKESRRKTALEIVALSPVLNAWYECATRSFTVDLFLMPQGWKRHVDEVQQHLPHRDPEFVRHIATDAVTLKRHKIGGVVRAFR
jgi:hypothetical protein